MDERSQVVDRRGQPIEAHFDVESGEIVFHARGGAINKDYAPGLRLILSRLVEANLNVSDVLVDSRPVQDLDEAERRVLEHGEGWPGVEQMYSLITNRMKDVGRAPGAKPGGGNSTKRIRIRLAADIPDETLARIIGERLPASERKALAQAGRTSDTSELVPPTPEDREWAEGNLRLVQHFRRERNPKVAAEKKEEMRARYGRLFCERCNFEPSKKYGDAGDACIEVHHAKTAVAEMGEGHTTRLEDLECLCANCHRVEHYMLRGAQGANSA